MGERHLKLDLPTKLIIAAVGMGAVLTALPGSAERSEADAVYSAQVVGTQAEDAIPGQYIVVLKAPATGEDNAALEAAVERAEDRGAEVTQEYGEAINGYAATMSGTELNKVRTDPAVAYIAADTVVSIGGSRTVPSWGLDRIDQRSGLNSKLSTTGDGSGVTAYVIDTGVRATHEDFGGRVTSGYTAINDGQGTDDCHGHGTHVAGTVAGSRYGVAPGADIVAVRVLGCNGEGTSSGVLAAVNWVTANAVSPAVANMSLGGEANAPLDNAVAASIASGITYAVAAGNETVNACNVSPARVPAALTVAASTQSDENASFSNFGSCVDLYAPGTAIVSDYKNADNSTATMSGTSMASPHVAGAAALYLQANPGASPSAVAAALEDSATADALEDVPANTPNLLLYSGSASIPTPTPTPTTTTPTPAPTTATPTATPTTSAPTETPTTSPTATPTAVPTTRVPTQPSPTTTTVAPKPAQKATTSRGRVNAKTKSLTAASYTSKATGPQRGTLTGPRATNFDLTLQKWNGRSWVKVAAGKKAGSSENVSYTGTSGKYRWQVERVKGQGTYTLKIVRTL
ncbi:S8 family peptidase [Kineosporia rhizophila]|uniref:S8 family peptidase n=1 Tax=Kineosporia rhizophila TaxID=84633 RepID=UPI001E5592FB|nr:S8 family peptidase [Kineosporia rhizophila]